MLLRGWPPVIRWRRQCRGQNERENPTRLKMPQTLQDISSQMIQLTLSDGYGKTDSCEHSKIPSALTVDLCGISSIQEDRPWLHLSVVYEYIALPPRLNPFKLARSHETAPLSRCPNPFYHAFGRCTSPVDSWFTHAVHCKCGRRPRM